MDNILGTAVLTTLLVGIVITLGGAVYLYLEYRIKWRRERQELFYEAYRKSVIDTPHPILSDPYTAVHNLIRVLTGDPNYARDTDSWNTETVGHYYLDNWCKTVVEEQLPANVYNQTVHEEGKKILDTRCHSCVHRMSHFALGNCIALELTYEDKYHPSTYHQQLLQREGTNDRKQTQESEEEEKAEDS